MSKNINGYITDGLSTTNAGMCQWGYAVKNGHEYFIKEFLSPKYPVDEGRLGPELMQMMRASADAFYARKSEFYKKLAECRTGNNVVVLDFFRYGTRYYSVSDCIRGDMLTIPQIAKLQEPQKFALIKSLMYSVASFHKFGIVHSDLKPENLFVKKTVHGYCAPKIIDFDSGFFETDNPAQIEGSQNYFAPEALQRNNGFDVTVTTKADIWALGLLIHQYWCGTMPCYSSEFHYAAEAVLNGGQLVFDRGLPVTLQVLLTRMLSKEAEDRPSAKAVWEYLKKVTAMKPIITSGQAVSNTESGIMLSEPKVLN